MLVLNSWDVLEGSQNNLHCMRVLSPSLALVVIVAASVLASFVSYCEDKHAICNSKIPWGGGPGVSLKMVDLHCHW